MASLPTQTKAFPSGNRWGLTNTSVDVELSMTRLIHAAVTAGHDWGWRQSIASEIGAQFELLWKTSALQAAVCEYNSPRGHWTTPVARLAPTTRYGKMDPSERRALSYHLGITLAVAWSRQVLRIPWLLHLDVYQDQFNMNLRPGDSRPDLIGRHADGSWAVFEAKGRASAPSPDAETKAKTQSKRVVDIGGVVPAACFAFFAYFAADRRAIGRKKPKIAQLRVIDPTPDDEAEDSLRLPLFTDENFFRIYYQPWFRLLSKSGQTLISGPGNGISAVNVPAPKPSPFIWRELGDLDFRVGVLPQVALALEQERYAEVPKIIQDVAVKEGLADQYPDWAGDGLVIEPGDSWKKLWREK